MKTGGNIFLYIKTEGNIMKTFFIATLVGLLVATGAANANHHNFMRNTDRDKVNYHFSLKKVFLQAREDTRKKLKAVSGSPGRTRSPC
jgi:hypothetical protein